MHEGSGQLAINYKITLVPKVFDNTFLFVSKICFIWGLLMNLIDWFINLSVQTFQQVIAIYRRGNFGCNNRG